MSGATDVKEMNFLRQLTFLNPYEQLNFPLTMIGLGGIGSVAILMLTKMGFGVGGNKVTIYDIDTITHHNFPNQLHPFNQLDKTKTESSARVVKAFSGIDVTQRNEPVTAESQLEGIVVSGVDSMASRKAIWQAVKYKRRVTLYVDARMGGEVFKVYTVRPTIPSDVARYEKTLHSDEEGLELGCTEQSIIYNLFMVSAIIGKQLQLFANHRPFEFERIGDIENFLLM
ncbi:MAG: ThiF family adenylyltransferase [Candidatus Vogelbacteria bacterium]|nr:ThiF family adenylyltransferase [Candidatus Vogelbacteria bacterium]